MTINGVNRVLIAVRDLDAAVQRYSELLGVQFEDAAWTGAPFGIAVAISWQAGIELCAPLPGREADSAVSAFLNRHGEGVMNVFFATDDVGGAMQRAAASGIGAVHTLDYTQEEIDAHLGGHFQRYQEGFLDSYGELGVAVSFAAIERVESHHL